MIFWILGIVGAAALAFIAGLLMGKRVGRAMTSGDVAADTVANTMAESASAP